MRTSFIYVSRNSSSLLFATFWGVFAWEIAQSCNHSIELWGDIHFLLFGLLCCKRSSLLMTHRNFILMVWMGRRLLFAILKHGEFCLNLVILLQSYILILHKTRSVRFKDMRRWYFVILNQFFLQLLKDFRLILLVSS